MSLKKLFIIIAAAISLSGCAVSKNVSLLRENGVNLKRGEKVVYVDVKDGVAYFFIENKWKKQIWVEAVYVTERKTTN